MKYLVGYEDSYFDKLDGIAKELDGNSEEIVTKLCKMFDLDENTKIEELSVQDIIPGLAELLLGIPHEIITKPMMQLTAEDSKICEDALNRVMTVYTSEKDRQTKT